MNNGRSLALLMALFLLTTCLSAAPARARGPAHPTAKHLIYINWDGFDYRYIDWANGPDGPGTPVLNDLIKHGALYRNAHTGVPAITQPMQTSLVSGAWPAVTGNTYRYYDPLANIVKQTGRENAAETIGEAAARQGLTSVSVQQFTLQNRGTDYGDPHHLYIQPGGNFARRVDELIKILRGEPVLSGGQLVTVPAVPPFIALYGDDLDGTGHNEVAHPEFGYDKVATSSAERQANIVRALASMDTALGRLIAVLKEVDIYGQTAIVLTSDHGMYEFSGTSSLPELLQALSDAGFTSQYLAAGKRPSAGIDIAVVTIGLQVQLSWTRAATEEESTRLEAALQALEGQPWFGGMYNREQLLVRGAHPQFADFLVWPKDGHHFKPSASAYVARGQHDTPLVTHVPLILAGAGVRTGLTFDEQVWTIDVAPTMARLLGIEGPADATGRVLQEALLGAEGAPGQR